MRAKAHINLTSLRHNFDKVLKCSPSTQVLAVIKANGYGHGLTRVANALSTADGFAVTNVEEAITLREAGIEQRILVLEGFVSTKELDIMRHHHVDAVIHHETQIELLEHAKSGSMVTVWLKADTGMHRLGLSLTRLANAWHRLRACANVTLPIFLMSHLAAADEWQNTDTEKQIRNFLSLSSGFKNTVSVANSAAILAWPETRVGWVRPGIMLYGISPFPNETAGEFGLLPVMTLSTRLIAINQIPKGEAVGYGRTWVCPEDMPVGVAAIGYGDGYPRHAPSGCPVLVNGKRVPLIGRVSMDMITVDLRSQPDARVGDQVVLWGKGLPVEEVAKLSGTIGYELVCGVTPRVEFITRDS